MDILSGTISALRVGRPAAGRFVRHAPWGRRYPRIDGAGLHVPLEGPAYLIPKSGEPVRLNVGDVALLYLDRGHGIADSSDTPLTELAGPGDCAVVEGSGARSSVLCGTYEFTPGWSHPMFDELPEVVHVPASLGRYPHLRAAVDLLTSEIGAERQGREAMVPALLDAVLVYTLRAWFEERGRGPDATGWAALMHDERLLNALRAMHSDPGGKWTVEKLAAEAGMSRAHFARCFTALVGESPLAYLTRWRMIAAAKRLRGDDAPLATVAREVGYGSEFAFAKAFKRAHGTAPGQYRRECTAARLALTQD
ncbi:AraC family transcriptional regulator [Glycomyces salinus]|uniref:AraC family transcriptional regulator n=1 Tax=Glycomyces salinus TaxID=980294 RepID=UPI0018ECCDBB|nr:AraC family transcriptional regulator [Glycomyces salinus]